MKDYSRTWNYRLVKTKVDGTVRIGVHECYYEKNGEVSSWTENPVDLSIFQEDDESDIILKREMEELLTNVSRAYRKPIVDKTSFYP